MIQTTSARASGACKLCWSGDDGAAVLPVIGPAELICDTVRWGVLYYCVFQHHETNPHPYGMPVKALLWNYWGKLVGNVE